MNERMITAIASDMRHSAIFERKNIHVTQTRFAQIQPRSQYNKKKSIAKPWSLFIAIISKRN